MHSSIKRQSEFVLSFFTVKYDDLSRYLRADNQWGMKKAPTDWSFTLLLHTEQ